MNLDLLKLTHQPPTDDYVNNLFTSGFLQLITKPTRCKNNSATLIDHFITNVMKNAYTCGVIISNIFLKHSKNAKETWKTLKLAIRKTSQKNSDFLSINVNGIRITDNKIMANKFNEHFTSMAGLISKKSPPLIVPPILTLKLQILHSS